LQLLGFEHSWCTCEANAVMTIAKHHLP